MFEVMGKGLGKCQGPGSVGMRYQRITCTEDKRDRTSEAGVSTLLSHGGTDFSAITNTTVRNSEERVGTEE